MSRDTRHSPAIPSGTHPRHPARTLERLALQDGKYLVADVLAEDATFRPESFEGMEIPLAALWTLPGAD